MKGFLILPLLFLLFQLNLSAQEAELIGVGKVTKLAPGMPVAAAIVVQKGESYGVKENFNDEFTIDVPRNSVSVISYVGFATAEIQIIGQNTLDVALEPEALVFEEVIRDSTTFDQDQFSGFLQTDMDRALLGFMTGFIHSSTVAVSGENKNGSRI